MKNRYDDIVANVCLSLEYQLEKIWSICKSIELELDKHRTNRYICSTDFDYDLDFLINSFAILIEYYHTWVIQKVIGLNNPDVRISYKPLKKGDDEAVNTVMKAYKIGITERKDLYSFNFKDKCKTEYIEAMDFLFVGKNHEIFVLNNYIKHNHMMKNYELSILLEGQKLSVPFIYINKNRASLLNNSLLRHFSKSSLENRSEVSDDEYYRKYINDNTDLIRKIDNVDIKVVNGLEYVIGPSFVGLSIESLMETIKLASIKMLERMIIDLNNNCIRSGSQIESFEELISNFKARKSKTICNFMT